MITKKKKQGVFYTPEHIADYICRTTIIPYLSQTGNANSVNELIQEYEDDLDFLDVKLKNIKILDPACGHGVFLNKSIDILLEIHQALHESKVRKQVLKNNIYGVDLNSESVEITKLETDLDKNIKCGNSLIEDKAFNWMNDFKPILDTGGFDIIVGNPPYVRHELIKPIKPYLKQHYLTYTGTCDLYVYFFEKCLNLLKKQGRLCFICSNKFTKAKYGEKLRKLILENQLVVYNDLTGKNVFKEASVDTCIIQIKKDSPKDNSVYVDVNYFMKQNKLNSKSFMFNRAEVIDLREKIFNQGTQIKDLDIQINRGILTGFNKAFIIDETTRNMLISKDIKNKEIIKPLLRGRDINKWKINYANLYLIHSYDGLNIEEKYPVIYKYLCQFQEQLEKRYDKGEKWYNLRVCSYDDLFEKEKIVYGEIVQEPRFVYDNHKFYVEGTGFLISSSKLNLKYILALLNSKLLFWYFKDIGYNLGGKGFRYKKIFIEQLSIKFTDEKHEKRINNLVDEHLRINEKQVIEETNFKKWLKTSFQIDKLSKKLENYYELTFEEFLKELSKVKNRQTQELLRLKYDKSTEYIRELKSQIETLDDRLNKEIYGIYGLTEDEI